MLLVASLVAFAGGSTWGHSGQDHEDHCGCLMSTSLVLFRRGYLALRRVTASTENNGVWALQLVVCSMAAIFVFYRLF